MNHKTKEADNRLLFLCTGNYYRSRTAEVLFNHWAIEREMKWTAISYGLAENIDALRNEGPISPLALSFLKDKGISLEPPFRTPRSVNKPDLLESHKIIALNKEEHLPMVLKRFPDFAGQMDFWDIYDIDQDPPEVALNQLFQKVRGLIEIMAIK